MARADRLFLLLQALRRLPAPVTANRLADETGVSPRTLYRDIAALRAGGALIDGEAGIGYTLTEDPALPPQMLTRLEVEALVLGLAEVGQMGDPALARAAQDALAKVVATLPERVSRQALHATALVYRFDRRPPAPACLPMLRAAAWDEQAVDLGYADGEGTVTHRRIWPLAIVYLDQVLVCLAWCCLRQDFRTFRLDRISNASVTAEWFRPRRVALLRECRARLVSQREGPLFTARSP
jgi:predicted DNA-binding transcriptional regulator YafY